MASVGVASEPGGMPRSGVAKIYHLVPPSKESGGQQARVVQELVLLLCHRYQKIDHYASEFQGHPLLLW